MLHCQGGAPAGPTAAGPGRAQLQPTWPACVQAALEEARRLHAEERHTLQQAAAQAQVLAKARTRQVRRRPCPARTHRPPPPRHRARPSAALPSDLSSRPSEQRGVCEQVKDLEAVVQRQDAQATLLRTEATEAARLLADSLLQADRAKAAAAESQAEAARLTQELLVGSLLLFPARLWQPESWELSQVATASRQRCDRSRWRLQHRALRMQLLQEARQQADQVQASAQQAAATAADLQQHVTWQEARISELKSQVPRCTYAVCRCLAAQLGPLKRAAGGSCWAAC